MHGLHHSGKGREGLMVSLTICTCSLLSAFETEGHASIIFNISVLTLVLAGLHLQQWG